MSERSDWQRELLSPERWAPCLAWNEAIRDHLFDGRFAGRPVYLELSEDRLERLGERVRVGSAEAAERNLKAAVRLPRFV